jgi:hypothetical protein
LANAIANLNATGLEPGLWIVANSIVRSKAVERTRAIVEGCALSRKRRLGPEVGGAAPWGFRSLV